MSDPGPENAFVAIGKMAETLIHGYAEAGKRVLSALGVIATKTQSDYVLCPDSKEGETQ